MSVADDLRRAKEYMFEHGWHRGGFEGPEGRVCMLAALDKVARPAGLFDAIWTLLPSKHPAVQCLVDALPSPVGVAHFNDAVAENFDQVVEVFEKAIKLAELREADSEADFGVAEIRGAERSEALLL